MSFFPNLAFPLNSFQEGSYNDVGKEKMALFCFIFSVLLLCIISKLFMNKYPTRMQ